MGGGADNGVSDSSWHGYTRKQRTRRDIRMETELQQIRGRRKKAVQFPLGVTSFVNKVISASISFVQPRSAPKHALDAM